MSSILGMVLVRMCSSFLLLRPRMSRMLGAVILAMLRSKDIRCMEKCRSDTSNRRSVMRFRMLGLRRRLLVWHIVTAKC